MLTTGKEKLSTLIKRISTAIVVVNETALISFQFNTQLILKFQLDIVHWLLRYGF